LPLFEDRAPDDAVGFLGGFVAQGPVVLVDFARLELGAEPVVRLSRERHEHHARSLTVEPMHKPVVTCLPELLELLAVLDEQAVEQCVVLVPDAGLGDDAGGLLDDEQIVVLVLDREGDALVCLDVSRWSVH